METVSLISSSFSGHIEKRAKLYPLRKCGKSTYCRQTAKADAHRRSTEVFSSWWLAGNFIRPLVFISLPVDADATPFSCVSVLEPDFASEGIQMTLGPVCDSCQGLLTTDTHPSEGSVAAPSKSPIDPAKLRPQRGSTCICRGPCKLIFGFEQSCRALCGCSSQKCPAGLEMEHVPCTVPY